MPLPERAHIPANFAVDPRLAALLGETYKSTEQAIKELVDNAWDADAENVWIELPNPMSMESLVVRDDGSGMTEEEMRREYLKVARDRRTQKGELTQVKRRRVKGRRGIGKFAGLMIAQVMQVQTRARGKLSSLTISRSALLEARADFEKVKLPFETEECSNDLHGTEITLSELNRRLAHPNADKLRKLLILDYGRSAEFAIYVNGQQISFSDIPGKDFEENADVPLVGPVKLSFKIAEIKEGSRHAGITIKVDGKPIGEPTFFGLDKLADVPPQVVKRIYGEVDADGLLADVTADWAAIIENSNAYSELEAYVQSVLRVELEKTFRREFNLVNARIKQEIDRRLSHLPEHRRSFAHRHLEKILTKFYGENEDKIQAIVSVVLDALERDEYWEVLRVIHNSEHSDVQTFAEALAAFGLLELAFIGRQTKSRQALLDSLDKLVSNPSTHEKQLHLAIEYNLWILGSRHVLLSSNKTLKRVVEEYTQKQYEGRKAANRPDLLLLNQVDGHHLLIEFKRPNKEISRDDEAQAQKYRDELGRTVFPIKILIIGGTVDKSLRLHGGTNIEYLSYVDLLNRARSELDWLIKSLSEPRPTVSLD